MVTDDDLITDAVDPLPHPLPGRPFVCEYLIDALPDDDPEHGTWRLKIRYRGNGLWSVNDGSSVCSRDGKEQAYDRWTDDPAFLAKYRMPLREALDLADRILPLLTINGHTVVSWKALHPDA